MIAPRDLRHIAMPTKDHPETDAGGPGGLHSGAGGLFGMIEGLLINHQNTSVVKIQTKFARVAKRRVLIQC